jgi:site-specific recombinase XerD
VPLTRALGEKLRHLMVGRDPMQPLFQISRASYTKHYRKIADHLKLGKDVVIHTLRHTCASWLVQRGVDLRRVQVWMGHKSIQTTLRYAKLSPKSLFEAVEVFDGHPANDDQQREAA